MPRLSARPPTAEDLRREVARLAGPAFAPGVRLAAAVSGGPDSLALLALGAEAFGPRLAVVSVDHGLRPEASAEAEAVAARAAALGLAGAVLRLAPPPAPPRGGLQAWAREARYAALAGWCRAEGAALLLTAHHADDQAETLLMRLQRGSGLSGLAGIRPAVALGPEGPLLLRPLLTWRKAELAAVVRARGWEAAEDPANRDPRFDRTRARAALARARLDPRPLAASALHLAEAEEALSWAAARARASRIEPRADGLLLLVEGLPAELRRRLLADGLRALGAQPRGGGVARLVARLEAGGAGTLGGLAARPTREGWLVRPAPPRRAAAQKPASRGTGQSPTSR